MKVLIVDDEIDLCLLLKSYFQRKGYDVALSHTLSDGLEKIETTAPNYLFLDNNLADGLGWKEVPNIVQTHPEIYIYLISAYHPAVPELPANSHFTVMEKPISYADLDKYFATSQHEKEGLAEAE